MGISNFKDYEEKIIEKDTLNSDAWEVVQQIENKFNRCVIFKSNQLFHSHTQAFGKAKEDSRLTQNFFLKEN
jgi:Rps23 Pro-64 3,4-dihydroxylase Tpa1-like proline 4-hydroxylase